VTPAELAKLHARAISRPRSWTETEFAELLAQASVHVSAEDCALAVGRTVSGDAELLTLAVLPGARRCGLARRHLAAFEDEARRRGARVAFLEVSSDNTAAIALYLSSDYVEVGRRPGYYAYPQGPATAAMVMRKSLCSE
jgi:ribosomal-protein-alanine N-acetyltransferase